MTTKMRLAAVMISLLVGLWPSLARAGHAEFVATEIAPTNVGLDSFTAILDFEGQSVAVSDVVTHPGIIFNGIVDPGGQVITGSGLNCFSFTFPAQGAGNGEPCKAPPISTFNDQLLTVNVAIVAKQASGNNLIGSIDLRDFENDVLMNFDPSTDIWDGVLSSDENECAGCKFQGIWVAVPEPPSWVLFLTAIGFYVAINGLLRRLHFRIYRK